MQTRIPLPTDNIYKFYSLFGLLILLATGVMYFIRHDHYNDIAFSSYVPIERLKAKNSLTDAEKHELYILEERAKIASADKQFELGLYLTLFFFFGTTFTGYGFYHWHTKIQPKQDRLLELQIKKAELEIKAFNKELQRTRFTRR